ncbi:hypothetical protein [Micromonospora sp. CA-244673]
MDGSAARLFLWGQVTCGARASYSAALPKSQSLRLARQPKEVT